MTAIVELISGERITIRNVVELIPSDRTLDIQFENGYVAIPLIRVNYWRVDV